MGSAGVTPTNLRHLRPARRLFRSHDTETAAGFILAVAVGTLLAMALVSWWVS